MITCQARDVVLNIVCIGFRGVALRDRTGVPSVAQGPSPSLRRTGLGDVRRPNTPIMTDLYSNQAARWHPSEGGLLEEREPAVASYHAGLNLLTLVCTRERL